MQLSERAAKIYFEEIETQCDFAIAAVEAYQAAKNRLETLTTDDLFSRKWQFFHREVFRNLHSFLTHASCLSRLLFPGNNLRGSALRALLNIPDHHALSTRTLRDHFEHFDERIDSWAKGGEFRPWTTTNIGPRALARRADAPGVMRWLDKDVDVIIICGSEFDIRSIHSGVLDVNDRMKMYQKTA